MKVLLAILGTVSLITFLAAPTMGAGWFWDIGNGLGFAAFAGVLYLGVTSYRRIDAGAHRVLGYTVLLIAVAHAFWFILGDAAVVEYMKPGAPDYMWLGIAGLILLFVLIVISLVPDRLRVHRDYPAFLTWHRVLAIAVIVCCAYHIIVSDYYLATWFQKILFVAVATVTSAGRQWWIKLGPLPVTTPAALMLLTVLSASLFGAIRNLSF